MDKTKHKYHISIYINDYEKQFSYPITTESTFYFIEYISMFCV